MDGVQRGAPHRGDRVRVDHDAQAGRRPLLVPGRGSAAGRRHAVRRPPRRRVRAGRLPRTISTTTACSRRRFAVAPDVVLDERTARAQDGWRVVERRLRQTAGCATPARSIPASPPSSSVVTAADARRCPDGVAAEARSRSPRCVPLRCRSSDASSSRLSCYRRRRLAPLRASCSSLTSQPAVTGVPANPSATAGCTSTRTCRSSTRSDRRAQRPASHPAAGSSPASR